MGRSARGVRALNLKPDQSVIAMLIRKPNGADSKVLVATENGYGKQTSFSDFPLKNRGGQGVIAIKVNGRNGRVVGAEEVADGDELMLITGGGRLVRIRTEEIPVVGRNTQGVRLIRLAEDESLVSLGKVIEADDESVEEVLDSVAPEPADD
jgi:DNA gyrase subunit A